MLKTLITRLNSFHTFKYLKYLQINNHHFKSENLKLSYIAGKANAPLLADTIGQQLDKSADLYENRDSFVFSHSNERLTFRTLKQKVLN